MNAARRSDPVRSLDTIGPASDQIGPGQVKAGLRDGLNFVAVWTDAVIAHYGSVKETAYALGQVDPSLMMREFGDAKFGRFAKHADELAKAAVVSVLNEAFGQLTTPRDAAFDAVRTARKSLDVIAQALEHF